MEENDCGGHLVNDTDSEKQHKRNKEYTDDKDELEIVRALADFCAKDDSQVGVAPLNLPNGPMYCVSRCRGIMCKRTSMVEALARAPGH